MGTTLQHGIFLPAEGERNCYAGLASNWTILDGVVGGYGSHAANLTIHVTAADKEAWNGKADDTDVVHKSGNETINGLKTFSNDIRISKTSPFCNVFSSGYIKGQAPTSNIYAGVRFFDDINSGSTNNITGGFEVEYNRDGYNKSYIVSRNYAGENHKFFTVGLRVPNDDIRSIDFLPSVNGIVNLGTPTNKWKSFNGINPGALGMPNLGIGIDISGYITHLDKVVNNYTPPSNGWLVIRVKKTSLVHTSLMMYQPGGLLSSCETDEYSISGTNLLVIANQNVEIYVYADVLVEAKFYPCQGNV